MNKKKYNFKILAKDIIYKDVDQYTIEEFKKKLSKFDVCPVCKKDWNKIRILKNHSSPLARTFKVQPDTIKDGWTIKNVEPICTTCNNRVIKQSINEQDKRFKKDMKIRKFKQNGVNIIMIALLLFGALGWYHGFEGWGGEIALWIVLIFMILFIITLLAS
tara:strand:+ start:544 stop:1026 length:483 start_codon:yes stop_codon:yes gene_type:complete